MSNIKFLKGYGISIKQHKNQIQLTNGSNPFTGKRESESYYITKFPYEKIVLSGDGYISTKAIELLLENNIHLIQVDTFGNLITSITTPTQSLVMTKWRMGQYQIFSDESKKQKLRRYFLGLKLQSQIRFCEFLLSDYRKSTKGDYRINQTVKTLKSYTDKIKFAKTEREIAIFEKESAIIYFKQYADLIPKRFDYVSRNSGFNNNQTREKASNVINALLNYGYSVLASDITKYVHAFGLDPYYGFNHKSGYFMALVYDLIEPFRTVVDSTVLQMANSSYYTAGRINKKDYHNTVKGYVLLDTRLITMFLERLQNMLNRKRPYKISAGRKSYKLDYKMSHAQESTIIKENVRKLADYCIGKHNLLWSD